MLECFHTYIDRCDAGLLASFQNSVYTPMIDKCLGAPKPNLKAKAMDCMLLIFEVSEEFGDETMEALQNELKSKKPKVSFHLHFSPFSPILPFNADCPRSDPASGRAHDCLRNQEVQPGSLHSTNRGKRQLFRP